MGLLIQECIVFLIVGFVGLNFIWGLGPRRLLAAFAQGQLRRGHVKRAMTLKALSRYQSLTALILKRKSTPHCSDRP